jgi:hypothetical protein
MGHEIVTLSRGVQQIREELRNVGTPAQFEAFRKRWCKPWDRTIETLNNNPLLKGWVIRHWDDLMPRILVQRELAGVAWKCAADSEGDLQFLSALD